MLTIPDLYSSVLFAVPFLDAAVKGDWGALGTLVLDQVRSLVKSRVAQTTSMSSATKAVVTEIVSMDVQHPENIVLAFLSLFTAQLKKSFDKKLSKMKSMKRDTHVCMAMAKCTRATLITDSGVALLQLGKKL